MTWSGVPRDASPVATVRRMSWNWNVTPECVVIRHMPLNGAHRSHARTRARKDVRLPRGRSLQAFKHGHSSRGKGDGVRVSILRPLGCDRPEAGGKVDLREGQPQDLTDARPGIEAEPNRIADPTLRLECGPDGPDLVGGESALSRPLLGRLLEAYARRRRH